MKLSLTVKLDPAQLAEAFCELNDEQQAQFFVEVAEVAKTWENGPGMQWYLVGKHLRDCPCSTWEAKEMVREMAEVLKEEVV